METLWFAEAEEDSGTLQVRPRMGSCPRYLERVSNAPLRTPSPGESEAAVWKPMFEQDPEGMLRQVNTWEQMKINPRDRQTDR